MSAVSVEVYELVYDAPIRVSFGMVYQTDIYDKWGIADSRDDICTRCRMVVQGHVDQRRNALQSRYK